MSLLHRLLVILLLSACPFAHAATVCVTNAAGLVQALVGYPVQPDGETLTIQLAQGTYAVGATLGATTYGTYPRTIGLRLLGGYNATCTSRTINPLNTVIDGLDQAGGMLKIVPTGDADVLVEGISFTRIGSPSAPASTRAALGLILDLGTSDVSAFRIRHCRFVRNSTASTVEMSTAQMFFVDNLVADNLVGGSGAAALKVSTNYDADSMLVATNNTIANNSGGAGMRLIAPWDVSSGRLGEIVDNIVWGNAPGADIDLSASQPGNWSIFEQFNLIGTANGITLAGNDLRVDPRFANAAGGNYALASNSPAINSGSPIQLYGFPSRDLAGGTRIVGSTIDRGAYESAIDDTTTAVVTTVADNGNNTSPTAGSLRAAIKAANAASGPFRILFNIAGACPRILNLAAPMLDITGDVTIDGTTQPGWVANSELGRFDATNCLLFNGLGNASTPWALHVPSSAPSTARAVVRGLIFAGFNDAAIKLEGGSNHRIWGSQFGAVGFTLDNHHAIRVTGNAKGAFIGGYDDPGAVNLIAGTEVGVYLDNAAGGSTVANAVIGYQADGEGNGGNGGGVLVFQSPNNVLQYNFIGNGSGDAITLSGAAATGNRVQYNRIGLSRGGNLAANGGSGVLVNFGAHDNVIGAPLPADWGGNTVVGSAKAGVWISASGGTGNRVLANRMDNVGQDIDLAAQGPSANQASNPASGPNALQNYPQLIDARHRLGASSRVVVRGRLDGAAAGTYRIDVYWHGNCAPGARGHAWLPLGHRMVKGGGSIGFEFSMPVDGEVGLGAISATATDAAGNTSEIGNCRPESADDTIFFDGYE